jgi:capsular polysaccharide biosynthesis protein
VLPARYAATTTLVVRLPDTGADTESLVRTVQAIITSSVVLGDLARESGTGFSPTEIDDRLEIERPPGSAVIEVKLVDPSREQAVAVVEELIPSLRNRLDQVQTPAEGTTAASAVGLQVDALGDPEVTEVAYPWARNAVIGGVVGLGLGLLLAVALAARRARRLNGRETWA